MTQEEKAKAYDEAIRKARITLDCCDSASIATQNTIYDIFPELKESEGEIVRKWLIEMVEEIRKLNPTNSDHNGMCGEAIAWLEKQGGQRSVEPNWLHHKVDMSNCSEEYKKAYYDGWNNCNQQYSQLQAEQKTAWSEEDEKIYSRIYDLIHNAAAANYDIDEDVEYTRTDVFIEKACDAYCKVCGHYPHETPNHICRQACDYYKDFRTYMKGE